MGRGSRRALRAAVAVSGMAAKSCLDVMIIVADLGTTSAVPDLAAYEQIKAPAWRLPMAGARAWEREAPGSGHEKSR